MRKEYSRLCIHLWLAVFISNADCDPIPESQLVFSYALGLESLNLTTLLTNELHTNGHNIFDLDMLWEDTNPQLFWSDLQEGKIYSGTLNNGVLEHVKVVVSHGIVSVEGIAVDWIGHNLYLVESRYGWIEVADLKHMWRSVIVTNIDAPRALALDSRDGLLFWTDRSENRPKIERSTMAGRNRVAIVDINSLSDGGFPNGLTIDYSTRRLFWIDAKSDSIYSADYEGSQLLKYFSDPQLIQSPFGLSFYNGDLYWVDAKLNAINRININNVSSPEVIYKTYHSLFGVIAVHPHHHPQSDVNQCLNMGCSHLCLLDDKDTALCRCPQLMILGPDGKRCQDVEEMILVSEFHKEGNDGFSVILGLSDNSAVIPLTFPIVPPSHTEIVGLELDEASGYVYWADANTNSVWKASVVGNDITRAMYLGYGKVTGFGANWKNATIYYSSAGTNKGIFKCSITNSRCISIVNGFHDPHLLALHPTLLKLFWVEKNDSRVYIVSSGLDGNNKSTLYDSVGEDAFKSFTLDPMGTELYWIDGGKNEILRYDMSGVKPVTTFNSSYELNTLIIDKERILVSDESGKIHALDKTSGEYLDVVYNSSGIIKSLRSVKTLRVASHTFNPCAFDNGGCPDQCIYEVDGGILCLPWPTLTPDTSSHIDLTSTSQYECNFKCKNGGQCRRDASGKLSCQCYYGHAGHVCQHHLCRNCVNGQCYMNEKSQPLCFCYDGYYGKNCDKSICSSFCKHGTCQDVGNKRECACNAGWTGSMCEFSMNQNMSLTSCSLFCMNNGICEMDELTRTFSCSCPFGFSGDRCEVNASITGSCLALILVSTAWGFTLLSLLLFCYEKRFKLLEKIFRRRRGFYAAKHDLLVDYNSNGPSAPVRDNHIHGFSALNNVMGFIFLTYLF
ncbi:hypothetical protein CHUAL_000451 [Chamberlinius hualienensis]